MSDSTYQRAIQRAAEYVEKLHTLPEVSFQEVRTTAFILSICNDLNLQIIDIGMETGVVAWLDCGKSDSIALRADIDAVPTDHGASHLCGHDYHTASLLGAMTYLCANKGGLPHNVLFIFQPAEECTSGAKRMLKNGLLEKVPQIPIRMFGIHNRPEIPCGKIGVRNGTLMAEKTDFHIIITGQSGHGGTPHLCVDPIIPAAQLIMAIQTIISRNIAPKETAVCAVCSINCGTTENFAPENAILSGSIRTLTHNVHARIQNRISKLSKQIADAFECDCYLEWIPMVPALHNDCGVYELAKRAAEKTVRSENVVVPEPSLGSEDFSVFSERIPSFFYWVGSGEANKPIYAWHNQLFHVPNAYFSVAVPLLIHSARED